MKSVRSFAVGALALALVLTACGGGQTTDEPPAPDPTGTEPAGEDPTDSAPDPIAVRFLQATESLSFANVNYARSMGYFEDEGLDLEILPGIANSAQVVQVLITGEADVIAVGSTGVIAAVAAGRDVRSIAVGTKGATHGVTMNNEWVERVESELGVTPDSPIEERVRALEGSVVSIAGSGSTTDVMMRSMLGDFGVDADRDIELRYLADHPAILAAARQGQVDGMVIALPDRVLPVAEGWGQVWIDFSRGDAPPLDSIALIDLTMRTEYLDENPEVADRFLRALWRATQDFNDDPESVRQVLRQDWFNEMDEALFNVAFDGVLPLFQAGPMPTEESFSATIGLYNATAADPADLTLDDVYDASIASRTQP